MTLDKLLSSSELIVEEDVFDPAKLGFHETCGSMHNNN